MRALLLLLLAGNLYASPYAGDWDLKSVGLRILDTEDGALSVTWCKRIPFVRENRCTSKEVILFNKDPDGIYSGSDAWGTFWLLLNSDNHDLLHYKATPKWGSEIFIDGVRIPRN